MLSQKLKKYREDNKITQEELASKLNVSRSAVAKWEQEKGIPYKDTLKEISELFGISQDDLLEKDEAIAVIDNINKTSKSSKQKLIIIFSSIIAILIAVFIMYKTYGSVIDRSISPDGTITLTVYDNGSISDTDTDEAGYKIIVSGKYRATWIKENCKYSGLYWSSDSRYVVQSFISNTIQKSWLELTDFQANSCMNLQLLLEHKIADYYDVDSSINISQISDFQFLEWSDETNLMLVKYNLDYENSEIIGYFWTNANFFEPLEGLTEISYS